MSDGEKLVPEGGRDPLRRLPPFMIAGASPRKKAPVTGKEKPRIADPQQSRMELQADWSYLIFEFVTGYLCLFLKLGSNRLEVKPIGIVFAEQV